MKNIKETIAENLVFLRKTNKMTQLELAEKLNYSDKSISKWEHAETLPDIEILKKLADLYGVTVDYLITDSPSEEKQKLYKKPQNKQNKIIIALLGISFVWILATVLYVYANLIYNYNLWLSFLWAIPISCVILFYFNKMWGKRKYSFILSSIFFWALITCVYLQFLPYNMYLVFIIGVPIQIAIILWAQIKV